MPRRRQFHPAPAEKSMAADKIFRNDIQPEFRNRNGRKKAQKAQNTRRGPGFVAKKRRRCRVN
jgi:hypothetical protein